MSWEKVFNAYPEAEQIYVVDGMPFINKRHADSHTVATKKPVEVVKRQDEVKTKKADMMPPVDPAPPGGEENPPAAPTGKKKDKADKKA